MKQFYAFSVLLLLAFSTQAQYTQNFDSLINAGTGLFSKLPDGWGIYEVESGTGTQGEGKYAVGTGTSTTGNTYSFGAGGSAERSLGSIASNTLSPSFGALFFNESDSVITTVTIAYIGEQWRYGGRSTATQDILRFDYSLDAQGLVNTTGTWTRVTGLDFLSPNTQGTAAVALDGNATENRKLIAYTLTGLNMQPGGSLVLRWSDTNIAGNDDALAIDDFSISKGLSPGVLTSGGTNTGGGTGGGGATTTNTSSSTPVFEHRVATDSGFLHLYGNLHGHSTHSDGHASTLEPANDYDFARKAKGMDFLGISEHNHSAAGLSILNFKKGITQADTSNGKPGLGGEPFIALHGMEWGTISGGGHVIVYGYGDSLVGWEAGNYDSYVAKSDYMALFDKLRRSPTAVATLAHPGTSDFTGLTGGYKGVADSAVCAVAIESGPAFSTSTTYNDFPASLAYMAYYRSLLKQGYRVGATADGDNHEMTFGTANANRLVVLAKDRTRESLLAGIRAMRTYATNDYNARVDFAIGGFIAGSSIVTGSNLTGQILYGDRDGEPLSAVQVFGGKVRGADAALIHTATSNTVFTTAQAAGETWYYYAVLTQADGNKIVTSPIWVTKAAQTVLPVHLTDFKARLNRDKETVLEWNTAVETGSDYFLVERSTDLINFTAIGKTAARGVPSAYSFLDRTPFAGVNYYRLGQVDKDGSMIYSGVVSVNLGQAPLLTLFPNPSKGIIHIRAGGNQSGKTLVQVIDMAGNMVHSKEYTGSLFSVDLSALAPGTYVVRSGEAIGQIIIAR